MQYEMKKILILTLVGLALQISAQTVFKNNYVNAQPIINGFLEAQDDGIPTDGLVAYWPFNGNANDESDNSNDLTVSGATLTTDRFDNSNSAYQFDGVNDRLYRTFTPLQGSGDYSVCFWFLCSNSDVRRLFFAENDLVGNHTIRAYLNQSTKVIDFSTYESGYGVITGVATVSLDTWYFIVLTKSGTTGTIYINNTYDNSGTIKNVTNTTTFEIGEENGSYDFNGKIDDFIIYNRVLTTDEMTTIYNQ